MKKGNKEEDKKRKKEWDKKANDKLKKQILNDGDHVWLRDVTLAGKRAIVLAVRGVPGLDRIRIRLELTGKIVEIKRTDAVQLTEEDLLSNPYRQLISTDLENATSTSTSVQFFGLRPIVDNSEIQEKGNRREKEKGVGEEKEKEGDNEKRDREKKVSHNDNNERDDKRKDRENEENNDRNRKDRDRYDDEGRRDGRERRDEGDDKRNDDKYTYDRKDEKEMEDRKRGEERSREKERDGSERGSDGRKRGR